jgi:hypothetical protein
MSYSDAINRKNQENMSSPGEIFSVLLRTWMADFAISSVQSQITRCLGFFSESNPVLFVVSAEGPEVISPRDSIGADKLAKVVAVVMSPYAQGTLGAMSSGVPPNITGEELAGYAYAK